MQRIRLVVSWLALLTTLILGLSWIAGVAHADIAPEGSPECNCIDGFSKRDGVYGWDSDQKRYRCVTVGCSVITE
jgi:hypothetical protein